jgi:hypothetical protein
MNTILRYQYFDFEKIKPIWKSSIRSNDEYINFLLQNTKIKIPADFIEQNIEDFMEKHVIEDFTINYYDFVKKHINKHIDNLFERHERKNYQKTEGHDKKYLVIEEVERLLQHIPITKEIEQQYIEDKDFFSSHDEIVFWETISKNPMLEKNFIKKYLKKLNLSVVVYNNKNIDEEFINEFFNFFDKEAIKYISNYMDLSLNFIEEHSDELNWQGISMNQYMTLKFILKNIKKINPNFLNYNKKVNQEELKKYKVYEMMGY